MISESRIFKNEKVLSTEFLPEVLPHRESQIEILAGNLRPAAHGRKPQNTFVYGTPGIGKTASVKHVFRQFEEYSGVKTFYVNCWDYRTIHSILTKLSVGMGIFVARKGMAKDEVMEKFVEACKKNRKGLVICLDEADQIKDKNSLYDLFRINQYISNPVGVVFISNFADLFLDLEPRVKSSADVDEVEFKPYTLDEMKNILTARGREAFHAGVIEDGVVFLCANHAIVNGGDVRTGLECLMKAGRLAEKDNSLKLKVEHVKYVLPSIGKVKPKILEEKINEKEKIILKIVEGKRNLKSGELYEEYLRMSEDKITERGFRDILNHLIEIKLLHARYRKWGIRGRTRVISKV
ncbi:MAG: AAA family ATPase [Candidatus Aenigmarchaeota archaeon]|nr:AAA family ATPase [Candidatus Aenigmarchaeota archaeon]